MVCISGNKGETVRSDCWVQIDLDVCNGITINLESKVKALYEQSICELIRNIFDFYNITNASITLIDQGALPFTIAARIESALIQAYPDLKAFQMNEEQIPKKVTEWGLLRTSRLYLPGNTPKLMLNAGIYGSSGIILDLEDSVHPDKKSEARILVRNALRSVDFKFCERMVRINQLPLGFDDLDSILLECPNLVLVPKCESADTIREVDNYINKKIPFDQFPVYLMPIIESALGVQNAFAIASSSSRNVALAIGLEDYTADIGVERSAAGIESQYARMQIVNAAYAAGIQPIDSVFSDVSDMEALEQTVAESKALGFVGMGCIHPRQIQIINKGYLPTDSEIEKAKKIVFAFEKAKVQGLGVVSLGSKMIDAPVVERANKLIAKAESSGQLNKTWREGYAD